MTNLAKKFFEEENSDNEVMLQNIEDQDYVIKKSSLHLQQFWSIPISRSATDNKMWTDLINAQKKYGGRLFDVITCDPPWQLSSANPTRGVAIQYSTLGDNLIKSIPI